MENFNNVPSSGTFGSVVSVVNQNFALAKEAIDKLAFSKSACMGFYETSSELNDAHPTPTDGDWALVGNSSPFNVYVANNGSWEDSGVDYNVTIQKNDVVNDLTTGGANKALSAEMGNVIRMQVETILSSIGDYAFPNGKPTLDWSGTSVGITTNLVDVISSNPATSVDKNGSYTTTLSGIHEGNLYVMDVEVVMAGIDITATAYNEATGIVSITEASGTIVITAKQYTYIQDDLVLHLDGKNRGNISGHWLSLTDYDGSPIDFTLTNCDESHSDYVAGNGTTSKGVGNVSILDLDASSSTIEACYNDAAWNNDTLCIMHNKGSNPPRICLSSWHPSSFSASENVLTIGAVSGGTDKQLGANYLKTTIIAGGYVSCVSGSARINDEFASNYNNYAQSADNTSMLSIFWRKTSSNERFFQYNLYSLRVYSRKLTDEEREQNYKVDKKRFNII